MIDITFADYIDVKALFEKYGFKRTRNDIFRIGYDGKIYILPEPRFIDNNRERFSVIVLYVDWDSEKLIDSSCYDLGEFDHGYYHIQPIGKTLLMVNCRCSYNNGNPDKNAFIISPAGEVLNRFCLGDGIRDVFVRPDNMIVTSYFDEGIYGNFGWGDADSELPIGCHGLIVWNSKGEQQFHAEHNISDCYALNVDEKGNIWYYYNDDFKLVRLNETGEIDFDPGIEGAHFFVLTEDCQKVIFNSEYNGIYEVFNLHKNDKNGKLRLLYKEDELLITKHRAYGAKALFIDNKNRMFVKRFIQL